MCAKKSAKRQRDKRQEIIDETYEYICEHCRLPDILDENALPAACDRCEVRERLEKME
nr:MAG TPA: hypothetical protein [Caudoviricetes sp.]